MNGYSNCYVILINAKNDFDDVLYQCEKMLKYDEFDGVKYSYIIKSDEENKFIKIAIRLEDVVEFSIIRNRFYRHNEYILMLNEDDDYSLFKEISTISRWCDDK